MELDGSTIDSMGSGPESEGVSYGNAGDAFGNASLASSRASGRGTDSNPNGTTGIMPGIDSYGSPEGIIGEVGADFGSGSIASHGSSDAAGGSGNPQEGVMRSESDRTGTLDDLGLSGDAGGNIAGNDMELGNSGIAPYSTSGAAGINGNPQQSDMGTGNGENGALDDLGLLDDTGGMSGNETELGGSGIAPYDAAGAETVGKTLEDDIGSGKNAADVLSGITPPANRGGMSDKVNGDSDMDGAKNYGDEGSNGITGAAPVIHEAANRVSEEASMPDGSSAEENPYMADERKKDAQMPRENADHSMEPMGEMGGQMNHMRSGGPIPAENQKGDGHRKPAREFREVPKTREELRRRQQERKEQKQADGIPLK